VKQHANTIGMKGVYLLLVSAAVLSIFAGMEDELLCRPSDNNQFLKSRIDKHVYCYNIFWTLKKQTQILVLYFSNK
jgi:hypothetical protein